MAGSVSLLALLLCTLVPWVEARGSAVALVVRCPARVHCPRRRRRPRPAAARARAQIPPRKSDCMYHEASAAGMVEFRVLIRSGGARDIRVKIYASSGAVLRDSAVFSRTGRPADVLAVHTPGPGVLGICLDNAVTGVATKVVEVSVVEEGRSLPADDASVASLNTALQPLERAVQELAGHLRAIRLASDKQTRFVRDVGAKVGLLTTTETAVVAGLAVAQVLVLRRVLASPAVVEALATSV